MKTINILGTEYSNADGLCKEYDKQIKIRNVGSMLCDDDPIDTKKRRFNEVLRHEIIHAFFSEAGLNDYSSNEQLVDWLAIQSPKLFRAFKETDCL